MRRPLQTFNFSIQNAGTDSVDIHIDGEIVDASTQQIMRDWWGDETSVSFKSFRDQVNASTARVFNIFINSPGGHVGDAMAIHDLLVDLQTKGKTVNTIGRGIIASAATYILMAGRNSEMSQNSWFMIHNASGFAYGTVDEVENQARTLRKFNDAIRDFYANATGMRKEEVTKLMNSETWMTAEEAKEKGFVKNVSGEVSFSNSIQPDNWMFNNTSVLAAYNSAVKAPPANPSNNQIDEMKKLFNDFKSTILNAIKGVKVDDKTDNQALVNSIAEAVSNSFEGLGDQMDTAVAESVTNALKGEAVTNLINEAVTNATKGLNDKITNLETAKADLEQKNKDLEAEITNKLGSATNTGKEEEGPKPVGSFKS